MPQNVRYTARRSLISGHSDGAVYTLDLALTEKDRQREANVERLETLTGNVHSTYHGGVTLYRLETRPLTLTETRAMREFLDSVEHGAVFYYDDTHVAGASPGAYQAARIEKPGYTEKRAVRRGDDQTSDRFVFSFTLRLVP